MLNRFGWKRKYSRKPIPALILLLAGFLALVSLQSCGSSSDSTPEWKFAYMSDNKDASDPSGVNLAAVGRIAMDMRSQGVHLVMVGGDLIDGRGQDVAGLNAQYSAWIGAMAPVYNAGASVYAIPGNHEYWGDTEDNCVTAWMQTMAPALPAGRTDNSQRPGREYTFVYKNAFFFGLDQTQFARGDAPFYYRGNDVSWVSSQLQSRDSAAFPHVFAFGHMPMFMTRWGWTVDSYKANREDFWNTLGNAGAQIYFTGHTHLYAHGSATTADGQHSIHQVIAGSGGANFEWWDGVYYESDRITPGTSPAPWNNDKEGYALVTVKGMNVQMDWRYYDPATGSFKVGDSFSYTLN